MLTKKILKIAGALILVLALILLCIWLIPLVLSLSEPENQVKFREFIDSLGIFGVLGMLLLQITQIIIAVIPGEPIELLMGLMYGTLGGLFLSLLGIAVGQMIVFWLVLKFGVGFAKRFVNTDKFRELEFLKNESKRDGLIFTLFFIPGTPKDVLTYFAPFTGIAQRRFLILSTLARIPSVVTSTWAGASVSSGNFTKSIIIFAATGIVGAAGILINNYITKRNNR